MLEAGLVRQDPFKAGSLGDTSSQKTLEVSGRPTGGILTSARAGAVSRTDGYTPAFFVPLGSVERPRGQMLPTASPVGVLPAKEGS